MERLMPQAITMYGRAAFLSKDDTSRLNYIEKFVCHQWHRAIQSASS
jgi:hypothetical protein